jgi:chaperonin cofactor prefoldin
MSWFERVQRAQAAYGILPKDTYNFDEVGFTMGRTLPHVVVTKVVSLIKSLSTLTKGAKKIEHKAALLEERVSALKKALKAATERKGRKKTRIQKHGSLSVLEGRKIAA